MSYLVTTFKKMPLGIKIFTIVELVKIVFSIIRYNQPLVQSTHVFYNSLLTFGLELSPIIYVILLSFFVILQPIYLVIFFKKYRWGWYVLLSIAFYMIVSVFFYLVKAITTPSTQLLVLAKKSGGETLTVSQMHHPIALKWAMITFGLLAINYYLVVFFYFLGKKNYFNVK